MTTAEPTPPDLPRLRAIGAEAEGLQRSGEWNREAFERLLAEAEAACGGHRYMVEFLLVEAEPEWRKAPPAVAAAE